MNRTLTALATATLLMGSAAFAQNAKDDLFAGTSIFEKNATNVTEINQGPDTLHMVRGAHASTAHGMILNVVKSYEYDQPGQFNMADVDKFRQRLDTGDWHCSVHERNMKSGESTDVCEKARTDGMRETAIITVEKKELTFIHQIMKEGDGGHSDASMMMMPGMVNMTAEMAMAGARMAESQGQMAAHMGALQGQLGGLNGAMTIPTPPAPPAVPLHLRKFPGAPSNENYMTPEDAKAPKAPQAAAPSPEPAPAAPATPAPAPVQ